MATCSCLQLYVAAWGLCSPKGGPLREGETIKEGQGMPGSVLKIYTSLQGTISRVTTRDPAGRGVNERFFSVRHMVAKVHDKDVIIATGGGGSLALDPRVRTEGVARLRALGSCNKVPPSPQSMRLSVDSGELWQVAMPLIRVPE